MSSRSKSRVAALGLSLLCGTVSACDSTEDPAGSDAARGGSAGATDVAGAPTGGGSAGTSSEGGAGASSAGAAAANPGGAGSAGSAGSAMNAGAAGASAGHAGAASGAGGSADASTGGGAGAASGGTAGATTDDPFVLAWQDDFDTLDASRWQLQTFSFDGNLAQFSTENASVANGILSIALTPEPTDTVKPYRGVELRSVSTITYGKVEARMRFAKGSGVVSSLVLIYTPWPADNWNEIDIEHLGKQSDTAQLNCQVYTGPPTTPPVTVSVSPTQDPTFATFGFDAEADFHVYSIAWTPSDVRFSVDGTPLRTWSSEIARMTLPQNILLTIWASSAASWAGPIAPDSAPTSADIDWIKVYDLVH